MTVVTLFAGRPEIRTSYANQRGLAYKMLGPGSVCVHHRPLVAGCAECRRSGCVLMEEGHSRTPATDDVRSWLDEEFPERDVAVEHTPECDRQSYGDQCQGGCSVVDA